MYVNNKINEVSFRFMQFLNILAISIRFNRLNFSASMECHFYEKLQT